MNKKTFFGGAKLTKTPEANDQYRRIVLYELNLLEVITSSYMECSNNFWVACSDGRVFGRENFPYEE